MWNKRVKGVWAARGEKERALPFQQKGIERPFFFVAFIMVSVVFLERELPKSSVDIYKLLVYNIKYRHGRSNGYSSTQKACPAAMWVKLFFMYSNCIGFIF